MRDRHFFPLAAILAGAFVFTALQPFADRCPRGPASGGGRNAEDITIAGREFCRFVPGNFDGLALIEPADGAPPVLRITRLATDTYEDPRVGPNLPLAEDVEYALESREVEVVINARSAGDFAASEFEANYFARPEGESGWQKRALTSEFQDYSFTYKTPSRGDSEGRDYVGIRPVAPDKRRVMEVRSVRVHAVAPKVSEPETGGASILPPG
jgi:hypothetical protein